MGASSLSKEYDCFSPAKARRTVLSDVGMITLRLHLVLSNLKTLALNFKIFQHCIQSIEKQNSITRKSVSTGSAFLSVRTP